MYRAIRAVPATVRAQDAMLIEVATAMTITVNTRPATRSDVPTSTVESQPGVHTEPVATSLSIHGNVLANARLNYRQFGLCARAAGDGATAGSVAGRCAVAGSAP
jgi:hypothetical protein